MERLVSAFNVGGKKDQQVCPPQLFSCFLYLKKVDLWEREGSKQRNLGGESHHGFATFACRRLASTKLSKS